jgi:hypothetical protein
MNIAHTEEDSDSHHSLCKDKTDIILSEAWILLKYPRDENDTITVENEIAELRLALDLLQ